MVISLLPQINANLSK